MKKSKLIQMIDYSVMVVFYLIFSPFTLLYVFSYAFMKSTKYLLEKILNPICNKLCKLIRGPIPNSTVHVKGLNDSHFRRVNDKLLTIKEAKELAEKYKSNGYEVHTSLSEF